MSSCKNLISFFLIAYVNCFPRLLQNYYLNDDNLKAPSDELYFENKIDHFGNDQSTYKQRYWGNYFRIVNDQFFDPKSGIVFVYICGEAECAPRSTSEFLFSIGSKLKAKLVTVEHR